MLAVGLFPLTLLGIASWRPVLAQCEAASATAPRTISAFRTPGMEAIEASVDDAEEATGEVRLEAIGAEVVRA